MRSDRPKFVELRERTIIEGLRKAGMPEWSAGLQRSWWRPL